MQRVWQHVDDRRWNFWVLGIDIALFSFGAQISSFDTVVPLLMTSLTRENWPVTLIVALRNLGTYLPVIIIVPFIEPRSRILPLLRNVTLLQRLPFAILALVLLTGQHSLILIMVLLMSFVQFIGNGLSGTPWTDIVLRAIPEQRLGRFLGNWIAIGTLLGLGGASLGAFLINTLPWPNGFIMCFLSTFVLVMLSMLFQQACHEPERQQHFSTPLANKRPLFRVRHQLGDMLELLKTLPPFRHYVISLVISSSATLGIGLLTPVAVHQAHLPPSQLSGMIILLALAGVCGNVIWGWFADRFDPKLILILCTILEMLAMASALIAHDVLAVGVAFFCYGMNVAGTGLARQQYNARFGTMARRPTFIAISSLAIAPGAVLGPLLGGILADRWGYPPVFALDIVLNVVALVSIVALVNDQTLASPGQRMRHKPL